MSEKICWVIDDLLLEKHDNVGFPTLAEAARDAGHDVIITKYVPLSEHLSNEVCEKIYKHRWHPVIAYGTVGFVKQFQKLNQDINKRIPGFLPGAYLKQDNLKYSTYSTYYGDFMLNDDFIMLPYAEVKRRIKKSPGNALEEFPTTNVFMRPDTVTKSFAGRVYNFGEPEDCIEALEHYQKIHDSELVILAKEKPILAEFRHVICGQELVAQSQYRRNGVLDIRIDVDIQCQRLAKFVSRRENNLNWEPDYCYILDTALTPDGPSIIEMNAFSCSGLYACNTREIVKHVSHMAWREFNGEDIL